MPRSLPKSGPNPFPNAGQIAFTVVRPDQPLPSIAVVAVPPSDSRSRIEPDRSAQRILDAPFPLALWHKASLDAPTVAIVWTLGFAFAAGVRLPLWLPALVALVTWTIYIGDRLLDARSALAGMQPSRLRHRHRFHWRHRRLLTLLAASSACAALIIVVIYVRGPARERGAALGLATVAYFSGVHARRNPGSRMGWLPTPGKLLGRLPFNEIGNEVLVAAIFTCGCMLPVWPRAALRPDPLWPLALVAAFFMLLVWLNYHAIGRWEAGAPAAHISSAGFILALAGLAIAAFLRASHPGPSLLIASAAGSAFLLALLNRNRRRLTALALRASADLALIIPLVVLVSFALLVPRIALSLSSMNSRPSVIDPATKYCEGAPSFPASSAEKGGKKMPAFSRWAAILHASQPRYPCPADAAPNFNCLAGVYRWMEWASFGPFLGACRSTFLPHTTHCRNALVLGDGDGRFTARLLRANPHIGVRAVDASPAMLAALTRACGPNIARLTRELADLRSWRPSPSAPCDLVVTHFFLDCLSTHEVLDLARQIRPSVSPNALWVVSEFAIPPGWFGRLIAKPIVRSLYLAFGLLTGLHTRKLPDHASALQSAGFSRIKRRSHLGGLLVSELWTVGLPPT